MSALPRFGSAPVIVHGVLCGLVTTRAPTSLVSATATPTRRQLDMLRFIRGYQLAHGGESPSVHEIMLGTGFKSKGNAHGTLTACVQQGLLRRLPNRPRALELMVDIAVPTTADGTPLYFVPVPALLHHSAVNTDVCRSASSGKCNEISSEDHL